MAQPNDPLAEFRYLVNRRAQHSAAQWDASRRLIDADSFPATLRRLCGLVEEKPLLPSIKELLHLVCSSKVERAQDLDRESLKMLTGMPPSKAFRALCVYFDLVEHPGSRWPAPSLSVEQIEQHIRHMASPFDLLLHTDAASVLDLGAGDLSFAKELAALYAPPLQQQHRRFILHCLDRLHPHSKLGGPLHAEAATVRSLQHQLGDGFAFWTDQDMFDLRQLDDQGKLAPQYTIVTCWAPATPTFAYEPSRLSRAVISEDLSKAKGSFRQARFKGEPALEVQHGARRLLFPFWKFDVVGPLALLHLMARRGSLCVLGAVDSQVFWELLAQLLEDARHRPHDRPFNRQNLPEIFGTLYQTLERLPVGQSVSLSDLAVLRTHINAPNTMAGTGGSCFSFRSVYIRRGATFSDIPASSTARKFSGMIEETPPWFLTLIPVKGSDEGLAV